MKKTIAVVMGTRPEAIKLAPVTRRLQSSESLKPYVICTSQHGDMAASTLRRFDLQPDLDLQAMRPRQSLHGLTAILASRLGEAMEQQEIDAVLVQGDTTTAMVGGLCAFYHRIPVGHVEAGLRSHDRYSPFPEEMNRSLLGRIATWHFAPTDFSATQLLRENIDRETIHVSGNTVVDALEWMIQKNPARPLPAGVDDGRSRLILVTCHRRENHGLPLRSVALAVRHLADGNSDLRIVLPLHPNPAVREAMLPVLEGSSRITICEPLDHEDFLAVLQKAYFVLSDSGGVQEEATALGKPVLVLREETERPEGVEAGSLRLVGTDTPRILREAEILLNDSEAYRSMSRGSAVFGDGHASDRITEILERHLGGMAGDPVFSRGWL
jgi:UDP-N-acetylglucosamine 2-epimerase (non-hydrolysing)